MRTAIQFATVLNEDQANNNKLFNDDQITEPKLIELDEFRASKKRDRDMTRSRQDPQVRFKVPCSLDQVWQRDLNASTK